MQPLQLKFLNVSAQYQSILVYSVLVLDSALESPDSSFIDKQESKAKYIFESSHLVLVCSTITIRNYEQCQSRIWPPLTTQEDQNVNPGINKIF